MCLCQLSSVMNVENQTSFGYSVPEILNFKPLLHNLLKLATDLQDDVIQLQNIPSPEQKLVKASDKEVPQVQNFHRKLKNKIDIFSCVTKVQRKIEESFVWPLLESTLHNSSKSHPEEVSQKADLNLRRAYKDVDNILKLLHLNLRQMKSVKQSQSQHIIHDVISLLREHCEQLVDSFNILVDMERIILPLLMKNLPEDQLRNLESDIYCEGNVKEITNKIYTAVCSSACLDINKRVKLIKGVVNSTYMETLLKKGKWSTLFKFGSEYYQPNVNTVQVVHEVQLTPTRPNLNTLKRKLNTDCSSKEKKTTPVVSSKMIDGKSIQRMQRPSKYYKRTGSSAYATLVWDSNSNLCLEVNKSLSSVPLFPSSELRPTFNQESKLGCIHYERACKLRHPSTGRLHTCRLCGETSDNGSNGRRSPPLDRFAVTEILCMKCNTLQPSGRACINPECISKGSPFAKYVCTHCNLYDNDDKKDIYHCPHCKVCRIGKGLGIDFKHCVDCDACIGIEDFENHKCVPRRLKQRCPLCLTGPLLSDSTEPIQLMGCGHSFHTSCFNLFTNSKGCNTLKCPLCRHEDKVN